MPATPCASGSNDEDRPSGITYDQVAYITELAVAVDHFGIEAFSGAVTELAHRARKLTPIASRILVDDSEPLASRERAFAQVCLALTTPPASCTRPSRESH